MTKNDFKEVMHIVACSEESAKYYKELNCINNRRKIVKTGVICTAAIIAVAATALFVIELCTPSETGPAVGNPEKTLISCPTADPSNSRADPAQIKTPATTAGASIMDIFGLADQVSSESQKWFKDKIVCVKQLSYTALNSEVMTLNASGIGTELISAEAFGEHSDCTGVYYNPDKDEIVCLYHEFLASSQTTLNEGIGVEFIADTVRNELFAVRLYEKTGLSTEGLWIFDRSTNQASSLPLPDGCSGYNELYIYNKSLCNGRLSAGVNTDDGNHFIYVYNTETKKGIKLIESVNPWISAEFLSERILLVTCDGYSFYNVDTGTAVGVIGEYNYYANGKVYSVKNWGWANHNDVEVAAYDAETGAMIENETVLVQTVLDNGAKAFLTKNTTTGEETIVLTDYIQNCYTWTRDGRFFYTYSAANQSLLCYSASDGEWFLSHVPAINTEPVTIDGISQSVFVSYAISVADNGKNVLLYFTRTVEEIPEIPDYGDEKVDSPFWDKYREMKALNFADETCFGFAVKENVNIDGATIYLGSDDMKGFRDILISCLKEGTLIPDKTAAGEYFHSKELALSCGFLMMDFFSENGKWYLRMGYHMPQPVGWITEIYEIPKTLFEEINERCYNHMRTGKLFG